MGPIAEKALATLQGKPLDLHYPNIQVVLSPYPPTQPQALPAPTPQPRLIKQLPPGTTDAYLFDLFRPYGPIASISCRSSFGPDIGIVEYWNEEDARAAEAELHCSNIGGNTISVQVYQPRRAGTNIAAAPFVPSGYPQSFSSPMTPPARLPYSPNVSRSLDGLVSRGTEISVSRTRFEVPIPCVAANEQRWSSTIPSR